jgi:NAD(P)H-flavin reductase
MLHGLAQEPRLPPSWPAEVVGHERRGRDVAVIRCRPLTPLAFRAGQYVHVECHHHPREWRPYSIANAPRADGTLDLHVRSRDGWVSAALVHRLAVGDLLRLGPPVGTMTVDPLSTRDIVGVAGGTGLAAIKAVVEELSRCRHNRWVHLFVGARSREDLYDLPGLLHLAGRYPWLSVIPVCSEDPTYTGEVGLVSDAVQRYGPWPDHEFYVCGAPGMVRATLGVLSTMDTSSALVHYDALTSY